MIGLSSEIKTDIIEMLIKHSTSDSIYTLVAGGIVYGGAQKHKSDIDLMFVFDPEFLLKSKKEKYLWLEGFLDDYLRLHKKYGFSPDLDFPGEYVTISQIQNSINGRGFHFNKVNKLYLPNEDSTYFMRQEERWYRAWLSQSAFSEFVSGDKEVYTTNKILALRTIILYVMQQIDEERFTSENIANYLMDSGSSSGGFGVSKRYVQFKEKEMSYLQLGMDELTKCSYLSKKDNYYIKNKEKISIWEEHVVDGLKDGSIKKAEYLFNLQNIKEISILAKKKWKRVVRDD